MTKKRSWQRAQPEDLDYVPKSKAEARELGIRFYSIDLDCPHGHQNPFRYTSSGDCVLCAREKSKRAYKENPDRFVEQGRRWRESNRDGENKRLRDYYIYNKDVVKDTKKRSYYKHHATSLACKSNNKTYRKRTQMKSEYHDTEFMRLVMVEAKDKVLKLKEYTGIQYHIDHIVPLKSGLVCGLHWPENIQIITATENIKKGNRYWPNMP